MNRQQTDLNPLANIYDAIQGLVDGMIVKVGTEMDASESFETRKYVDAYIDALNGVKTYAGYEYTIEEFIAVGIDDKNTIRYYQTHPLELPQQFQNQLLKNRHAKIIAEYEEPNDYYRKLAGLPPLGTVGGIIVDDIVSSSFLVIEDDANLEEYQGKKVITRSSARNLMETVLFNTGDYLSIKHAEIGNTALSSTRSFRVVEDNADIKDLKRVIFKKDAYTISSSLGLDLNQIYDGAYLYIPAKHVVDTTNIVQSSFLVVRDDISAEEFSPDTMVKRFEARLTVPNILEGSYLYLKDFLYPSLEYEETYGLSRKVPIHKIGDVYGARYINILEALGYFDELKKTHTGPKYEYLDHLGTKKIDILTARRAHAYDLLWLPDVGNDVIRQQFSICYNGCRDYFMSTVYNYYFNGIYDYYENFIGLAICQMAIQQTLARAEYTAINRDFYDVNMVKMLFDAYDVPFTSRISQSTQLRIAKNLNLLIQNKASNKVIYDIASLLGYHDFQIYKYYLMKERRVDAAGNLIYADTTTSGYVLDDEGHMVPGNIVVNDLKRMYDTYFQKVELKNMDYQQAFQDTANRVNYDEITMPDPLWWDDQNTFDSVYGDPTKYTADEEPEAYIKHINYVETKYLGITISYKLSEVVFEDIILLRTILEKPDEFGNIMLTFPNITGTYEVSLFDTIVFLCAMLCKQSHISGEILTKVSTILDVIGYMTEDADGYIPCDTLAFNFELAKNAETFAEIMKEPLKWMSDEEKKKFDNYLSILTIVGDQKEKILAFNQMYSNIKGMGYFIQRKMSEATDVLEYRAWRDLYHALFIQKEISEVFSLGNTGRIASTYLEYLQVMNPRLFNVLLDCEDYLLYTYIDHVIYRMTQVIDDLSTLQAMNDSNSSLHDYLIKLIKFFKSYTTDMVSLDTQYIFDLKPDNLLKLTESYMIHQTDLHEDTLKMIYSDVIQMSFRAKIADRHKMTDTADLFHKVELRDVMPLNVFSKKTCNKMDCKYRCKEDNKNCTIPCKFKGYDTSEFYAKCKDYIAAVLTIEKTIGDSIVTMVDLQEAIRAHLVHVGRIFRMVDSFRFSVPEKAKKAKSMSSMEPLLSLEYGYLTNTLTKLNDMLTAVSAGFTLNSTGVDAIIDAAKKLTVEGSPCKVICRNPIYPCLTEDVCPTREREEISFTEEFVQTDKIFERELLDWTVDWFLEDYLLLLERTGFKVTLHRNEESKLPIAVEGLRSELFAMYQESLKIMDAAFMQMTQTVEDRLKLREDLYTYYEDPV